MKPNIITLTLTGALTMGTAYGQDDPARMAAKTKLPENPTLISNK